MIGGVGFVAVAILLTLAMPSMQRKPLPAPEGAAVSAAPSTASGGPRTPAPPNTPNQPAALSQYVIECPRETLCFPNGHREAVRWREDGPRPAGPDHLEPPYAPHMPALLARAEAGDDGAALLAHNILSGCARSPADPAALDRAIVLLMETHQLEDAQTGYVGRVGSTKIDQFEQILRQGYADCEGVPRLGEAERLKYLAIAAAGPKPFARVRYAEALRQSDPARARQLYVEAWDLGYLDVLPHLADYSQQDYQSGTATEGLIDAMAARYVYASLYHARYGMDEARIIGRHVATVAGRRRGDRGSATSPRASAGHGARRESAGGTVLPRRPVSHARPHSVHRSVPSTSWPIGRPVLDLTGLMDRSVRVR
ncbi:MAG: hypothetical protein AAGA68_18330 [Pseudomonadota bacterium]